MEHENIWSVFAESYDVVLRNWSPYQALVAQALEHLGPVYTILDQGCGTGIFALALACEGKRVIGIDNNQAMLDRAKQSLAAHPEIGERVCLLAGNALDLKFSDELFDGVISNNVIFYVEHPIKMLEEAYRVLRPGGRLFLSGPRPNPDFGLLRDHSVREFKSKGLYETLGDSLEHFVSCSFQLKTTGMVNTYQPEQIVAMLEQTGFRRTLCVRGDAYFNQSYVVVVEK